MKMRSDEDGWICSRKAREQGCTKVWKLGQREKVWQVKGKNLSQGMEQVALMD